MGTSFLLVLRPGDDGHGVAVGKKTVVVFNGLPVCVEDAFTAGEGGDEKKERGFRQMEIGNQVVDNPERKSWINEQVAFSGKRPHLPVLGCGKFQGAHRGGPDRPDPAAGGFGTVDLLSCFS